ncbi:STAS domain-containing protein [Rufibacter psychrotolerans]|uniref:STAS domain-containing protein n=1 Tax=Rufibacter psychrotolerans TaxID=2812556 RepID=UPI0019675273|nr:STAS domain-containing protein [Rufibacter sp. SYSU D00308]
MEITTKVTDAGVWVSLRGSLDAVSGEVMQKELQTVFQHQRKNLLIDFAAVTEGTPAGLRSLLPYVQQIHEQKMELVLFNLNEKIQKMVNSSGFNSLIVVVDSLDSAIEYALRKSIKKR